LRTRTDITSRPNTSQSPPRTAHTLPNKTDKTSQSHAYIYVTWRLYRRGTDWGRFRLTWRVLADPEGNEFCLLQARIGPLW